MSDTVLVALIVGAFGVIQTLLILYGNRLTAKYARDSKIQVANYHKEVNGMKAELVATTKELGHAEGKAEEKQIQEDKK